MCLFLMWYACDSNTWKGLVLVLLTERAWLLIIGLIPWSESLRVCLKLLCLVGWLLRLSNVSRFVEICRFQGVLFGYTLVFHARKRFYACCFVQGVVGTWILFPCWRSINLSKLNLNCFLQIHFSYFFVTWFHGRTWVRWAAPVISEFLLG